MVQSIRGFKDILPKTTKLYQDIIKITSLLFNSFGYEEIWLPFLEKSVLFTRSIGEKTDIVEKEMYTFSDDKGKYLSLRPEATASIVRAYIQHKMYSLNNVKRLYTIGPMFRKERPQKGRYRQFYQIDAEIFGSKSPYVDVELIFFINRLLDKLAVKEISIHLNSLGCSFCRSLYKDYLITFISNLTPFLCNDCLRRKNTNPMRILDCKNILCREIIFNIKGIVDFLCYDCSKHFNKVKDLLYRFNIDFELDKYLVRGLDYYNRTTFEIYNDKLGYTTAIAGGGRYDGLVSMLGGPNIPAIGFALGLDRLAEIVNLKNNKLGFDLYIVVIGIFSLNLAFEWKIKLCDAGIKVKIGNYNNSLRSQLRKANNFKVKYVLIVGDREINTNGIVFKCMQTKIQYIIPINDVVMKVRNKIFKFDKY